MFFPSIPPFHLLLTDNLTFLWGNHPSLILSSWWSCLTILHSWQLWRRTHGLVGLLPWYPKWLALQCACDPSQDNGHHFLGSKGTDLSAKVEDGKIKFKNCVLGWVTQKIDFKQRYFFRKLIGKYSQSQ